MLFGFVSVLVINYVRNVWMERLEEAGIVKANVWVNIGTMVVVAGFVTLVNWLLCKGWGLCRCVYLGAGGL